MYTQVFSLYHDQTFFEVFLAFLMYLSEAVKFDYPKLIAKSMCEQLSNFSTLTSFKNQAFLMYLILDKYATQFQEFLEPEQITPYDIVSIVYRAAFLRDPSRGFSQFSNDLSSQVYLFIFEANYPRVPQQFQSYLHPQTKNQIGDWFLYPEYIVIRVYGSEDQPYRLPSFLTLRIFSLEVLRLRLQSDELHFSRKKQTSTFKVLITIRPFIVKNRAVIAMIGGIMACFGFASDFACQYDP